MFEWYTYPMPSVISNVKYVNNDTRVITQIRLADKARETCKIAMPHINNLIFLEDLLKCTEYFC